MTRRVVTLHHSTESGTTLSGTRYGDAAWGTLHEGWSWDKPAGVWRLDGSVGRDPDHAVIRAWIRALEAVQFEVRTDLVPAAITEQEAS